MISPVVIRPACAGTIATDCSPSIVARNTTIKRFIIPSCGWRQRRPPRESVIHTSCPARGDGSRRERTQQLTQLCLSPASRLRPHPQPILPPSRGKGRSEEHTSEL